MAAAAWNGTLLFKGTKGGRAVYRGSFSDVNAAFMTLPDGLTVIQLGNDQDWYFADFIVVTGGTDCSYSELWVNAKATGETLDHKSNLNTSNFRQLMQSPIPIKGGSQVRLKQIT